MSNEHRVDLLPAVPQTHRRTQSAPHQFLAVFFITAALVGGAAAVDWAAWLH